MIRVSFTTRVQVIRRIIVLGCLVVLTFVSPISGAEEAPDVFVRETFNTLIGQLQQHRDAETLDETTVRELFTKRLSPHIDYLFLSRWILRDQWVDASETQQDNFLSAFKTYIINTYALALSTGGKIEMAVKDAPKLRHNTAIVTADFAVDGSEPAALEFRLILREDKWLLFDVAFSGVSLALTFKADFNYVARDGGINAVTEHLRRRSGNSL